MPYTSQEIEAALARSNGQQMSAIRNPALAHQSLKERGQNRYFGTKVSVPYADKTAHSYAHVATFSMGSLDPVVHAMAAVASTSKSRWQDRRTCIAAVGEIVNSARGQAAINKQITQPSINPESIKNIPLAGNYYGFESAASTVPRKISHGTALILVVSGVLFITTSYPNRFVAGANGVADTNYDNLADLFGQDA